MHKHFEQGISWYTFDLLDAHPELKHGVFTKQGGVSGPHKNELHLSFNGWAPAEETTINLRRAEAVLGLPPSVSVRQHHTKNVAVFHPEDTPKSATRPCASGDAILYRDALIAPEAGVNLLVTVGDCQAVILYDPASGILGLVHSGWRGSVQNILKATVDEMVNLGAKSSQIIAAIGPSLGPCCAEFINYREELPEHFQKFMVTDNHFDFWAISRHQLIESGLTPSRLETAGICTKCSPEFFSYRRGEGGRFGIMAGVIREESK